MILKFFASLLTIALFAEPARATVTISGPATVQDAALWDGEFAGWNFGGSPVLEVGLMGGIYAEHHAVSLIRFDLSSCGPGAIGAVKLRLFKPKSFIQTAPVDLVVYAVSPRSGKWQAGTGLCEKVTSGATWNDHIAHDARQIGSFHLGDELGSGWLDLELPSGVVQKWRDQPATNTGVFITTRTGGKSWGEHLYFSATEHWNGNGPQLVIEGPSAIAPPAATKPPASAPANLYQLPPAESLERWLKKNGRLARFTADAQMGPDQARLFQFYDTTVREQLIHQRYQVPMLATLRELEALIAKGGDDESFRKGLHRVREELLMWEYIRETSWYTSGPLADALAPRQLAILFARSIFGRMEEAAKEKGSEIWQPKTPDKLEAHVAQSVEDTRKRLALTDQQMKPMAAGIADAERKENEFLALFRVDYDRCRQLLDDPKSDEATIFATVRDMHLHHELFLYYQSLYDTPRWSLLMKHAPPAALAKWVVEGRKAHLERQTGATAPEE
jgi:hypothetical protein